MKYFPMLGVAMPNDEALRMKLKAAIESSRKKKYHGDEGGINEVPAIAVQAATFLEEGVKPFEFYNEETKTFLDAADPKWKQAVLDKFSWIKSINTNQAEGEELQPFQYA